MSWLKIIVFSLAAYFVLVNTAYANNQQIWLFSTKNQTFTNQAYLSNVWHIKHYLIDGGRGFEDVISKGLSNNPKIAMQQAKVRLANKTLIKKQVMKAWQGAINAQSLNIAKVPAITFDKGKSVIYGVTDLLDAYQIWQRSIK